jgi:hypothetical protein
VDIETREILTRLSRFVDEEDQRMQILVLLLVERNVFTLADLTAEIECIRQ